MNNNIIEEKVIIDGETKIGATISHDGSQGKKPVVLLIMGTGKTDRDGNSVGFKSNIYKDLSDMFVSMGYVYVRYDKRGTHESTGSFNKTGLSDLVNDSARVIDYAKKLPYVDENKVVACGHSEGAMIATLLTKQEKLDRIILLGGACMCMRSALMYQNTNVIKEFENKKGLLAWYIRKAVKKEAIEKQVNGMFNKAKNSKKDTFFYRGALMPSKWLKEHGELTDDEFIKMIKAYEGKVLAITGTADLQADYTLLDKIKEFENVCAYTPKNISHVLRRVEGENSYLTIKQQYKEAFKKPIDEEVKKEIEEFMLT